ncbi:MAG: hypothetical protein LBD45_05945 [Bacteroidales bacterium]|nr:hypothetical protein [Bacteroidales bacterium]
MSIKIAWNNLFDNQVSTPIRIYKSFHAVHGAHFLFLIRITHDEYELSGN